MDKRWKYILGFAGIAAGIGLLIASNLPDRYQYYLTIDELLGREREMRDQTLKVAGRVEPGSLDRGAGERPSSFRLVGPAGGVRVTYAGALPDTLQPGGEVVVTGRYQAGGTIEAENVLSKCASKYKEKLEP